MTTTVDGAFNLAEFLTPEELAELTGYKHAANQRKWLDKDGWVYKLNGASQPIVGRWYARMRMSGLTPTTAGIQSGWRPDFSALR